MFEVRPLDAVEHGAAGRLIAAAMQDNPIHVAAWPDPALRVQALQLTCSMGLARPGRWALAALDGEHVVGVASIAPDRACRPSAAQSSALRERLAALGDGALGRYAEWRAGWGAHHPDGDHWHLGPFAVEASRRGAGIGGRLLREYCRRMDGAGATGYLEADRHENVGFYEREGFRVISHEDVIGVPTWFMERPPAAPGMATLGT